MKTIFTFLMGVFFFATENAEAHVKWFAKNTEQQNLIDSGTLNQPMFWGLAALSAALIGLLVFLDRKFENWTLYTKLNNYIGGFEKRATSTLRIFTGAAILLAWQSNSLRPK